MLKDILDSVKGQAEHRLSSPIFGSLVLSWLGLNYKYLLILGTALPIERKFQLADDILYPDLFHYLGRLYFGPIAFSLAYIFVYPHISIRLLSYWEKRAMEMRDQRNEIQRQTLLTKEESFQILDSSRKQREEDRAAIQSLNREIEGMRSTRGETGSSGLAEAQSQRIVALEHEAKRRQAEDSKLRPLEHLDPDARRGVEALIKFLVTLDGQEASQHTIEENCGWSQAQGRYFVEKATETTVATVNPKSGHIMLASMGREYAFRNGYMGQPIVQFSDSAAEAAVTEIIRQIVRNKGPVAESFLPKAIDHNLSMTGLFINIGVQQGLLRRVEVEGVQTIALTEEGRRFAANKQIS